MASRLQIAKPDIVDAFAQGRHVLRTTDIARLLTENRNFWRLAKSTSLNDFISFMIDKTDLRLVRFPFPQREIIGYTWGRVPLLETLLHLVDRSSWGLPQNSGKIVR